MVGMIPALHRSITSQSSNEIARYICALRC